MLCRSDYRDDAMNAGGRVDILVIGAGLAGCSVGRIMRGSGASVLIAELRDAKRKEKLCGGVLSHGAEGFLAQIYGAGMLEELGALRLDGMDVDVLDKTLPRPFGGISLPRKRLDDACLRSYLDAGGRLHDRLSLRWIDETAHRACFLDLRTMREMIVSYGVLVGADGAASAVRRLATGRIGHATVAVEGRVDARGERISCRFEPLVPGLCWYIPNGPDANVGCLFHGFTAEQCRAKLRAFCEREGYVPGVLRQALIPEGDDVLLQAGQDIWLVGDAAGLAEAFGGSGMHLALRSALALCESLNGGPSYASAMQPAIEELAQTARSSQKNYFSTCLLVASKGTLRAW